MFSSKRIKSLIKPRYIVVIIVMLIILAGIAIILTSFEEKVIALRGDFEGDLSHDFKEGDHFISNNVRIYYPSEKPDRFTPIRNYFEWLPKKDFEGNDGWDDDFFVIRFYTEQIQPYVKLSNNSNVLFEDFISSISINKPFPKANKLSLYDAQYEIEANQGKFSPRLKSELIITEIPGRTSTLNIIELDSPSLFGIRIDAWSYANSSTISLNFNSLEIILDGEVYNFQNETTLTISNFGHFQTDLDIYGTYTYSLDENTLIEFEDVDLEIKDLSGNITSNAITKQLKKTSINITNAKQFGLNFPKDSLSKGHLGTNDVDFSFYAEAAIGHIKTEDDWEPIHNERISVPKLTFIPNQVIKDYLLILLSTCLGVMAGYFGEKVKDFFENRS